jgi:hypothetical protein
VRDARHWQQRLHRTFEDVFVPDDFTFGWPNARRSGARARSAPCRSRRMQVAQAQGWVEAANAYLTAAVVPVWRMGEANTPLDDPARAAPALPRSRP